MPTNTREQWLANAPADVRDAIDFVDSAQTALLDRVVAAYTRPGDEVGRAAVQAVFARLPLRQLQAVADALPAPAVLANSARGQGFTHVPAPGTVMYEDAA